MPRGAPTQSLTHTCSEAYLKTPNRDWNLYDIKLLLGRLLIRLGLNPSKGPFAATSVRLYV